MGMYNVTLKSKFQTLFYMTVEIKQVDLPTESIFSPTPPAGLLVVRETTELYREGTLHVLKQLIFREHE